MGTQSLKICNRIRFTYEDDLALLREVLSENPMASPENWEVVKQNMKEITGKDFSVKTLKNHLVLLLQMFLKKQDEDIKKSGVEEEVYSERNHLLQEISDITADFNFVKPKKTLSKEKQISDLGRQIRDKISQTDKTINYSGASQSDYEQGIHVRETSLWDAAHFEHNYSTPKDIPDTDVPFTTEVQVVEQVNMNVHKFGETPRGIKRPILGISNADVPLTVEPKVLELSETNMENKTGETPRTKRKILGARKRTNTSAPLRVNALEYLNRRSDAENEIKMKDLQLQGRKLDLDERRLSLEERKMVIEEERAELEILERKQKMELEHKRIELDLSEKRNLNNVIASQQKIIDNFLLEMKHNE